MELDQLCKHDKRNDCISTISRRYYQLEIQIAIETEVSIDN